MNKFSIGHFRHLRLRQRIIGTECKTDLHVFDPHPDEGSRCQCGHDILQTADRSTSQFIKSCRRVRGLPCLCMEPRLVEVLCQIG